MTFNSLQYAAFLPAVVFVYWLLPHKPQNWLLFVASYFFYATFGWKFVGLLVLSSVTDYTVGRVLERTDDERRRKLVFTCSLVVNLGVLGFFKYYDFFSGEGVRAFGHLGLHLNPPLLHVLLPVGISFYTFHGISYAFDVFRRRIEPCHDPVAFAVFVSFFPQLIAGPIGRAHIQLPQVMHERSRPDRALVGRALGLILLGLLKKVAIADMLAPYVDANFNDPSAHGSVSLLLGVYAFALQIYGDFSGYSDIARGSSWLLGISLPENFNQPYLSRSITEFWRRWHISLSSWLRDYLYVPLGGNRGSQLKTYRNLMLTMLIGGLWHGAATTFVIWGGLHGLFLSIERRFFSASARDAERPWTWRRDLLRTLVTFQFVCLAWVFFRAPSGSAALHYLSGIAHLRSGSVDSNLVMTLLVASGIVLLIDAAQRVTLDHTILSKLSPWKQGLLYGGMATLVLICSGGTPVPFIYFRF